LALIEDQPGVDTVQRLLEEAGRGEARLLVSFISYMEVVYLALQERDAAEAQTRLQLMTALPAERVESTSGLGQRAAEVKARYRLSVADAWIAALADERGAVLVHKDPEFEPLEATINALRLPYKTAPQSQ
jgi:predicted nucleic acid-binding protein